VDASKVIGGMDAGDPITSGMFFRLTFAPTRYWILKSEVFSFQTDIQALFDKLDAADGLAQPVTDLTVQPGQEAAVFDVLVRPASVGVSAAYLANYFNELRFGITLTSMTLVPIAAVQGGSSERDALQAELDAAEKHKDPLAAFGSYASYLKWILILLVILALLYYSEKAYKLAKAAI
jgi:hypothetical protein